ncbi:mucin-5AC-like isoform X5 [Trematomus bernacchii]|uniref:mucin-5AC-like isoform X5 n=1 Tax=Trematomus bernacchii TaxID=40690 RepID=UPI00146B4752|nr:mucin-5AC-like isoform X5 [Trematomus bernacchii]
MPSLRLFFYIMGLVVASVTAEETATIPGLSTDSADTTNNYSTSVKPLNTTSTTNMTLANTTENNTATTTTYNTVTTNNTTIAPTTSNSTEVPGTMTPSTMKGGDGKKGPTTMTTQAMVPEEKTVTTPTLIKILTEIPKPKPKVAASEKTGIIILVVIILFAVVFGVACYCARRRQRRQSVDFTSRPDDANIPFSTFDVDAGPHNGLQTFESTESTTKELQKPEAKPEVQEEQTAEADKSVDDPGETAALVPPPGSAEDKPKEEAVEQSPPPPVELSVEEKTDDEGVVSNKTSVESLKETNENNSNSADFSQKKDLKRNNIVWDIPLECPV